MLFGRNPRLPVDLTFESVSVSPKSSSRKDYVAEWEKGIPGAYKIAAENSKKAASYNKSHHDKRIHGTALKPGDRVLVRNLRERGGTGKLRNYWEEKVHVVIDRKKESPVYVLKTKDGSGVERILHRNLLLPCDLLPFEGTLTSDKRKEKSKSSSYHRKKNSVGSETSDSDSSCDYNVYRVVPDEVTKSFPVSQQATPLVDSSSHHDQESNYSDNQDELPVNSDQQVTSNDIEELNGDETDEEQNIEIVSGLSSTENTHLNSDENIDNELQNPPRYPKRNHPQPERLAYNHLGESSNTSYVMSTHLQTRPSFASISNPSMFSTYRQTPRTAFLYYSYFLSPYIPHSFK